MSRDAGWSAEQVADALIRSGELALDLIDGEGRTAFAVEEAVRLLGYDDPAELVGRASHETIHHTRPDGTPFPAEQCPLLAVRLRARGDRRDRDWWVRRDGSLLPVSYHAAPVATASGPGGAVIRDLTETLRAEEEARRAEVERALLAEVRASRARIVEAADAGAPAPGARHPRRGAAAPDPGGDRPPARPERGGRRRPRRGRPDR